MKTHVLTLAFMLTSFAHAQDSGSPLRGPGEPGGSYIGTYAEPKLKVIASRLGREVRALPPARLAALGAPADWTRLRIARVLETLKTDTSPKDIGKDAVDELRELTFDKKSQTVTALPAFFFKYGTELEKAKPDPQILAIVRKKLLKDVSHLWDTDDQGGDSFAGQVLYWIDHNVLACVVDKPARDVEKGSFIYKLVTERIYFSGRSLGLISSYPASIPATGPDGLRAHYFSEKNAGVKMLEFNRPYTDSPTEIHLAYMRFEVPTQFDARGITHGRILRGNDEPGTITCVKPAYAAPEEVHLAVGSVGELPWWWAHYGGGKTDFTRELFNRFVMGRGGEEFMREVVEANGGIDGSVSIKIKGGTLIFKEDYYYMTLDESGQLVSLFIEGEEDGVSPDLGNGLGDDYLFFFQGPRAGTCARADDT